MPGPKRSGGPALLPELARRAAGELAEGAGEMALAGEAQAVGDQRQRRVRLRQQFDGAVELGLHDILVRADAVGLLEDPAEVGRGDPGLRRQLFEAVDRKSVV